MSTRDLNAEAVGDARAIRRPAGGCAASALIAAVAVAALPATADEPARFPPTWHCPETLVGALDPGLRNLLSDPWYGAHVLVVLDLDGDGRSEIVGGGQEWPGFISVAGFSGGRIGTTDTHAAIDASVTQLIAADVDGDGDQDVLAHSLAFEEVSLLRNVDGRLSLDWTRDTGASTIAVNSGLDPGGSTSILLADAAGRPAELWLDPGGEPDRLVPLGDEIVDRMLLVDADGDGRDDLLSADTPSDAVWIRRGLAEGGWSDPKPLDLGRFYGLMTVADLDGDGRDDLIVPVVADGVDVQVRYGDRAGAFAKAVDLPWWRGGVSRQAVTGDLDGDGHLDVALPSIDHVAIWRGGGPARRFERLGLLPNPQWGSATIADVTGDGLADFLHGGLHQIRVGVPGGAPGSTRLLPNPVDRFVLVDIDGDGDTELVTESVGTIELVDWDAEARQFVVLATAALDGPGAVVSLERSGAGGSESPPPGGRVRLLARRQMSGIATLVPVEITAGAIDVQPPLVIPGPLGIADRVTETDLDGDGDLDLAIATNAPERRLRILLRERGVLEPVQDWPLDLIPYALRSSDLDGDGASDLLLLGAPDGGPTVVRFASGGPGGPARPPSAVATVHGGAGDLALVDWDGDGEVEILVRGWQAELLQPEPAGAWPAATVLDDRGEPFDAQTVRRIADLDGDGRPDLAGRGPDLQLAVSLTAGPPTAPRVRLRTVTRHGAWAEAAIGDVDGDGRADVIARSLPEDLAVFFQRDCPPACPGDLTADGRVGFDDLLAMLGPIPAAERSPAGVWDLDGDLDRDGDDIAVLLSNWGPCETP